MNVEFVLLDLKLKLKKWEVDFMKCNGHKPTQQDISHNEEAKQLYLKYARLKKNSSLSISKSNSSSNVWGDNLLKSNSTQFCANDHLEEPNQVNECKDKKEEKPTVTYRDKFRKNISATSLKPKLSSLKKEKKTVNKIHEKTQEIFSEINHSDLMEDHDDNNLSCVSKVSGLATSVSPIEAIQRKPLCSRNIAKLHTTLINKPLKLSWIKENSDDLSDLINLENQIKSEATDIKLVGNELTSIMPPLSDSNVNKEEIRSKSGSTTALSDASDMNALSTADQYENGKIKCSDDEFMVKPLETSQNTMENAFMDSIPYKSTHSGEAQVEKSGSSSTVERLDVISPTNARTSETAHVKRNPSLVSTNFVRINMQQKKFSNKRGKGRYLRKQVFREKLAKKGFSYRSGWKGRSGGSSKSSFMNRSEDKCFKCGEMGHWASKCKNRAKFQLKTDPLLEETENTSESVDEILQNCHPSDQLLSSPCPDVVAITIRQAEPVFLRDNYDETEVFSTLKKFGYSQFRSGQEKAIKRILCGEPTLIVLSTGLGKSLCYQLPAYLYALKRKSITLVISPLVSLMDDQVSGLPKCLNAKCVHSGLTKEQKDKIIMEVEIGKVDILLVSPETLTSWAGLAPQISPLSKLPLVSFVCVDECHCLAEWSHSFRPSYLRICQVLKEHLGIGCLVGLTATAKRSSCKSIAKQLGIGDHIEGVIMDMSLPENLALSISSDTYKDEALCSLLIGERFKALSSIIIYCTRRDEAARLSSYLRTRLHHESTENENIFPEEFLEEPGTKKRKRNSTTKSKRTKLVAWEVDCYHAGMSAAQRKRVQNKFMKGKIRIVVATIAFGMGIDKQDVRAVIHYNMPRSFERYVQEVGRAGRDGQKAHCHLFLDPEGSDIFELGRHSYGKTVDRYVVQQLVRKVFPACTCSSDGQDCHGHLSAIPIESTVEELDLSREGIETLLCYLEMETLIKVYLPTSSKCYLHCYEGSQQMNKSARKSHAVALALANEGKKENYSNEIEFSLVKVANQLGLELSAVKRTMRSLVWDTTLSSNKDSGKSGITVDFRDPSFLVCSTRLMTDEDLDGISAFLHRRMVEQEQKELAQLQVCFNTMQKFSYRSVNSCLDCHDEEKSSNLKKSINRYFKEDDDMPPLVKNIQLDDSTEADVRSSVQQFLCVHESAEQKRTCLYGMAICIGDRM